MKFNLVVYTDLDGTLLDHFSYSFKDAKAMLERLSALDIAVIPNTSKTFAELIELRQQTGLDSPFIVENGAAVYIPTRFLPQQPPETELIGQFWRKSFSKPRSHWLNLLKQKAPQYQSCFQSFSAMSKQTLSLVTGLPEPQAELANQRQFSEPLRWLGSDNEKKEFIRLLAQTEANVLQGGRFIHISGKCNKGSAMNWLTTEIQRQRSPLQYKSIALGDSYNDVDMLEAADIAVQIKSPTHEFPKLFRTDALWQSKLTGPKGWSETMQQILKQELNITNEV